MSVQFGKCNFDGGPVDPKDFDDVRPVLAPYGPDGEGYVCKENFGILWRAFHTTKESRTEVLPHVGNFGTAITWDGRLDNREELIEQIHDGLSSASTDVEIVAAAYEQWQTNSFAKLIGDWALSIWDPRSRSLILAKDFIGARQLYYSVQKDQVTWCTILDPLVLFAGRSFTLEGEYIAGWLAFFPAPHLTPFVGIHSVPPSSFVQLAKGTETVRKYWDFNPTKRIRHRTDGDYEEHFRVILREAVRRRLRSDTPVLAELSGGMDSSSIVCVADEVIAAKTNVCPRLDTVSYYDDSEPNWDERPYFTRVERRRGRVGYHIDVSSHDFFNPEIADLGFCAAPGSVGCRDHASRELAACILTQRNRVVLTGIGGDEVTGGVPTPTPELQDLLVTARFGLLSHQLKAWALQKRKPWFHLLFQTLREFLPPALVGVSEHKHAAPWLHPDFAKRFRHALTGYESRVKWMGPMPSFQENLYALDALRRLLGCSVLPLAPPYEKRYPYLDRCLLEFMYAVPREQLVRPGQRRSLMRRALVEVVPPEILNRKRKAFVSRSPITALSSNWFRLEEISRDMASGSLAIVDPCMFRSVSQDARQGSEVPIPALMRTLDVELWLRSAIDQGTLTGPHPPIKPGSTALAKNAQSPIQRRSKGSDGPTVRLNAKREGGELS